MSSRPNFTRTPCGFYNLPRNLVLRIFTFLPLPSLVRAQRINKRFRMLITRSDELHPYLFLELLKSPPPQEGIPVFLHPVFERLSFFAYHPTKAIRIGEGLDSIFLQHAEVRNQFATSPALEKLAIRVISGGKWPFDTEISVENEHGVSVLDVIRDLTRYFSQYEKISFGEHFGADVCEQRGYNPSFLMQNHEFLNPDLPFPKVLFPDPKCNKVIIADYNFNNLLALPLVKRPIEWYTEEEEVKVQKLKTKKAPKKDSVDQVKDQEHIRVASQLCDAEVGVVESTKVEEIGNIDKNRDDMDDDVGIPTETGSMGSQSMDIDDGSTNQEEKNFGDSDDGSTPMGEAAVIFKNLTLEEKEVGVFNNMTDEMVPSSKPSELELPINDPKPDTEQVELTTEKLFIQDNMSKLNFLAVTPAVVLAEPISNTDTTAKGKSSSATPSKTPAVTASVPGDWDDAFS